MSAKATELVWRLGHGGWAVGRGGVTGAGLLVLLGAGVLYLSFRSVLYLSFGFVFLGASNFLLCAFVDTRRVDTLAYDDSKYIGVR